MLMPAPDAGVLARRAEIVAAMRRLLPAANVIADPSGLAVYECDALTAYRQLPLVAG